MIQWYEKLFANSGLTYDEEQFTSGTLGECDFIESEAIGLSRILDIGCGTGRHAIELSKRGYKVTGIDLAMAQLERARQKASDQNLDIDLRQMDARSLSFEAEFDMAIMLCEGAFPLMETDEMNFQILQGAYRALKHGGKLIFTTLNGLFPLHHSTTDFCNQDGGKTSYHGSRFDLMTFRDYNVTKSQDDEGNTIEVECNEHYYVPCELSWLLKSIGFVEVMISAARLGEFSREHDLTPDDYEMLVVCVKPVCHS
ncbi:MAG: class I SAM-dependent methyltransferase [Candidatus Cloacimonetes bacterium]|nr:class I SAM-dependent methyltransferase [Candidatus Cloacimonadota bacterium]